MNLTNWMSAIKDEVPINAVVMPGAHNAGSYGMNKAACCQHSDLYEQAAAGVRHFCLRLSTDKHGDIVMAHGPSKGEKFADAMAKFAKAVNEFSTEFFILDLREYYPQQFGPIKLTYAAAPEKVDAILAETIQPEKYALCDFDKIGNVTMGDIRKAGKRFMIINYQKAYKFSTDCEHILPWDKYVHGMKPDKFIQKSVQYFDTDHTDGIYWFQIQLTPNFGTELGLKSPYKLEQMLLPYFDEYIGLIASTPSRISQANVLCGDFMGDNPVKCGKIVELNVLKGNTDLPHILQP